MIRIFTVLTKPLICSMHIMQTSYPLGLPGPGLGGFQVTFISDEEMLYALTSVGASLGSVLVVQTEQIQEKFSIAL